MDNRERARARDKNQRRPISLEEKHKKFIAVVRKRENASYHRGEKERQRKKKVNRNTYNILPIKRVTRKFLEVSLCSCAKQRHRHMRKKPKKSCFWLVRKKVCFTCKGFFFFFFFWLIRSAYHLYGKAGNSGENSNGTVHSGGNFPDKK